MLECKHEIQQLYFPKFTICGVDRPVGKQLPNQVIKTKEIYRRQVARVRELVRKGFL